MSIGSALLGAGHDALPGTIAAILTLSFLSAMAPPSPWNPRRLSLALCALASGGLASLGMLALGEGAPVSASAGGVLGLRERHCPSVQSG